MTAPQWNVGDRIENRWEIHKILRGGMGIVYVVYDHEWREVFAAKTFQDEVFARNPGTADRFTLEARSWINLDSHQNVVHARFVHDFGGKPFLFLEYVGGGDLGAWVGTPRLTKDVPQVLLFAIQFCDGMTHALSKGIQAHRDIKPQNCLVTQDNILKVTDFGLAKLFDHAAVDDAHAAGSLPGLDLHLSLSGKSAGTCTHMAPEQFQDAKHVDVRADIYSFGVMLFQMLTGNLPFMGRTWDEFARLHRTAPPPPLASGHPSLDSIVRKCLPKAAAERYAGFGTLRQELASLYESITNQPAPKPALGKELDAVELANKGIALNHLGRSEEALAYCDRALAINPQLAATWHGKGTALGFLGRHEESLTCYDRALAVDPGRAEIWSNKGNALDYLGRPQEALACFDRALAINPSLAQIWSNKADSLNNLRRFEEGLVCTDRALAINPQYAPAWQKKAAALESLGRNEEALACFDRALAIDSRSARALYSKGVVLAHLGRNEETLACYDRLLAIDPRHSAAWYNKGVVLARLGRSEEALACYDRLLAIDPRHSDAWNNKGNALRSLGRCEEASACYDRALAIRPDDAEAWYNKGVALNNLGRHQEELDCYDRAIAIDPRLAPAWFNKGVGLAHQGRWEESLTCCDRALAINPQAADAWCMKSTALDNLGRFDEALVCLDRALAIQPAFPEAWYNKGLALGRRFGRLQDAIPCLVEAKRLGHPNAVQALAIFLNVLQPSKTPT